MDVEPNDSVGPLLDIIAYSKEQWKGQTPNPVKYRKVSYGMYGEPNEQLFGCHSAWAMNVLILGVG